ncbi:MAG: DUF1553 domain-containing protein [Pirellulales bacterium]|nr:DUF1553 domain-containing protein [Pirellulales bacterium]
MQNSLVAAVLLFPVSTGMAAELPVSSLYQSDEEPTPAGTIDSLVFDQLKQLAIQPARICSDAVFVRRVYIDLLGTLPTLEEARHFLQNPDSNKRSALIEHLLEREEFADYWAMKWGDLLRVKAEFPINLWPNAVQAYHRWIWASLRENMPYDRFARELLTGSGSNFRVPQVNFYRAVQGRDPQTLARAVGLTFMGTRAESWEADRLAGMASFFSYVGYKQTTEWKEEIIFFDTVAMTRAAAGGAIEGILPDGTRIPLSVEKDPREVFADWLIRPENPWFNRNIVNRIWYWLLGRGIIHEPDAIRPDQAASHPELLAFLEQELTSSKYDLKHIYRLILNSKTYQFSSISRSEHPQAAAYFASYPLRRLDAEVLMDALCQISGTTEEYYSLIPEPYTIIPEHQRSIALADGSITSSFLEMFGRPPRDTGLVSERNNRPTAEQRLHLLNSTHIRQKIERGDQLNQLIRSGRNQVEVVRNLYLTILSRFPTEEELQIVRAYSQSGEVKGRNPFTDLAWALINSAEFIYRH